LAIDTRQKRMSAISPTMPWRGVLVYAGDVGVTQGNRQASAFTYSGILAAGGVALAFVLDLNTRLRQYLANLYSYPYETADLTSLMERNLSSRTGDMSIRFRDLIDDATA
jgi:hypothetical protein